MHDAPHYVPRRCLGGRRRLDGVITLTENVDISASGYTVAGDITLDLNGFELKAANTGTGSIKSPGRCEAYAERQFG